jgi:hypothetical protein
MVTNKVIWDTDSCAEWAAFLELASASTDTMSVRTNTMVNRHVHHAVHVAFRPHVAPYYLDTALLTKFMTYLRGNRRVS